MPEPAEVMMAASLILPVPASISSAILDQWVDCMIAAGVHQDCEFDGWGTEVKSDERAI
ncbi:MAG TPA: hypothetical protein VGP25_14185 [Gemmatimonadaceae bacterium]|jgi:hypothetical protein|nr:hypothetical protein [Gemmatimonadaceae bacterium]